MTAGNAFGDVRLSGAPAIGSWLSALFDPTRCEVVARGQAPVARVAPVQLRSLRGVLLRVDRPVTVVLDVALGPVLTVRVGHGPGLGPVTRPATPTARRHAPVISAGEAGRQTVDADEVVALVHLPQAALEAEAAVILGHALNRPMTFDPIVDLTGPTGERLAAAVAMVWAQVRNGSALLSSDLAERRLEQLVLDMFLLAADHIEEELVVGDDAVVTPWVRHAVELLDATPARDWSVSTLSQEVAVSERALHHGFRRDLDTTPMTYLLDLRLDRAHEALAHRPVGTTVTEAAHDVGLTHLGRFASAYRVRFGEAPSQTLRR